MRTGPLRTWSEPQNLELKAFFTDFFPNHKKHALNYNIFNVTEPTILEYLNEGKGPKSSPPTVRHVQSQYSGHLRQSAMPNPEGRPEATTNWRISRLKAR